MGVKYKYPGEAEVKIDAADNYQQSYSKDFSKPTLFVASGRYKNLVTGVTGFMFTVVSAVSYSSPSLSAINPVSYPTQTRTNSTTGVTLTDVQRWGATPLDTAGKYREIWTYDTSYTDGKAKYDSDYANYGYVTSKYWANGLNASQVTNLHYKRIFLGNYDTGNFEYFSEDYQFTDIYPSEFESNYKLIISRNGSTVFERRNSVPPEYVEIYNKCPPNTCEVDCGSKLCCYDSNGIAIESFDI